jgi:hypothetical protein
MKSETIVMCVVALLLGMLLANMLKSVCGCKNLVEGVVPSRCVDQTEGCYAQTFKNKGDPCTDNCDCCSANCTGKGVCGSEGKVNNFEDFVDKVSQKYL